MPVLMVVCSSGGGAGGRGARVAETGAALLLRGRTPHRATQQSRICILCSEATRSCAWLRHFVQELTGWCHVAARYSCYCKKLPEPELSPHWLLSLKAVSLSQNSA